MENKNQLTTLYVIIGLLVVALGYCIYTHQLTNTQPNGNLMGRGGKGSFGSGGMMKQGGTRMGSGIINNFSPEQKVIIDELKKARDSGDKDTERLLMDKLRANMNSGSKD